MGKKKNKTKRRRKGNGRQAGDSDVINSNIGASRTNVIMVPADRTPKRITASLPQACPRNINRLIYWFTERVQKASSASISSSGDTEANFTFNLADIANYSSFTGLFDQYGIYMCVCQISLVGISAGTSTGLGRLTTAIDYDNVTSLSSQSAVMQFGTAEIHEVVPNLTVVRVLKPCIKPALYSPTATPYSVGRMWIDTAVGTAPHYGLRTYWSGNATSGLSYDLLVTYVYCGRNAI